MIILKLVNGNYTPRRLTFFIGNFGSGKTETAVNFGMTLAGQSVEPGKLSVADLDIVNPYFRCREAVASLEERGIKTVYPKGEYTWADLPIILPEIKGLIENKEETVIFDVGGDDVGAKVLSSFSDYIDLSETENLFVLNSCRPWTGDVKGATRIIREVSESGNIKITGLVANPHLIDETTPDIVYEGVELAKKVSLATKIPMAFVCVMKDILQDVEVHSIPHPILAMERLMLPPWK